MIEPTTRVRPLSLVKPLIRERSWCLIESVALEAMDRSTGHPNIRNPLNDLRDVHVNAHHAHSKKWSLSVRISSTGQHVCPWAFCQSGDREKRSLSVRTPFPGQLLRGHCQPGEGGVSEERPLSVRISFARELLRPKLRVFGCHLLGVGSHWMRRSVQSCRANRLPGRADGVKPSRHGLNDQEVEVC